MKTTALKQFISNQKNFWKSAVLALSVITLLPAATHAQEDTRVKLKGTESFGHTLNIGLGPAYFGYLGYTVPFVNINYEINVARDFTLAPSIGFASYRSYDYYVYAGRRYYYHETIMPVGLKGTYYFDRLLNANSRWDFYLAATLGFNIHRAVWDDGYYGDRGVARAVSPLYLDAHIGAEYHLSRNVGLYLDVSSGVSTLGLGFHHL